nr:hypothetical protein CFP56_02234 [Quercus suber]
MVDGQQKGNMEHALDSDKEHALKEELANEARRTQLGNNDCYNPNMEGISRDNPPITEQTQHTDKHSIEEPTSKGKKVAKKVDRASKMTMALQSTLRWQGKGFPKKREGLLVAPNVLHNPPMVATLAPLGEL